MITRFILPFPPSVNAMWRNVGGKTLLSAEGRSYRKAVADAVLVQRVRPIAGKLFISIDVMPPDHRRRDLDNLLKGPLDALQHAGIYEDDGDIDYIAIERCGVVKGGELKVIMGPATDWGIGA